jgi:hypothetical protein
MAQVIDLYTVKNPECNISPSILLPFLSKIKRQNPREYRNIIKAICIYGDIPVEHLMKTESDNA